MTHSPDCVGREPYYNSTNWILLARNYIEHCETVKQKSQSSGWQKKPNSALNFVHFVALRANLIVRIKKISAATQSLPLYPLRGNTTRPNRWLSMKCVSSSLLAREIVGSADSNCSGSD
jgi:hypothetical protein